MCDIGEDCEVCLLLVADPYCCFQFFQFFFFFLFGWVLCVFCLKVWCFCGERFLGLACSSVGEGVCVYLQTEERERDTHTHMELWVVFLGEQKKDVHAGSW